MKEWLEKHPKAAQWIREGGLFLVFSYVVTFIKYLILQFLPNLFHSLVGSVEWIWPGIELVQLDPDNIIVLALLGNKLNADGTGGLPCLFGGL